MAWGIRLTPKRPLKLSSIRLEIARLADPANGGNRAEKRQRNEGTALYNDGRGPGGVAGGGHMGNPG
jgi:hypothetical protein